MQKLLLTILLSTAALTSCTATDWSQVSTLQMCDTVLNFYEEARGDSGSQYLHNNYLSELSRRGEDCSDLQHLIRVRPPEVNVNVDNQT